MPTSPPPPPHDRRDRRIAGARIPRGGRTLIVLALVAPAARRPTTRRCSSPTDGAGRELDKHPAGAAGEPRHGCPIGTVARCETAVHDGSSRMDVLKSALARLVEAHAGDAVSIGLMRSNNDGRDGVAARGGFVAQDVAPLTPERIAELERWLCPPGLDRPAATAWCRKAAIGRASSCWHRRTTPGSAPSTGPGHPTAATGSAAADSH